MKRHAGIFVTVVMVVALFVPVAMAELFIVNGMHSSEPVDYGVEPEYSDHDYALDTEFIDFDDMVAPCYFADQVALTNEYSGQGIVFSGLGEVLDECGNFGISNYSSPNFLAFNTGAGVPGPEDMLFNPPIQDLTLYAGHSSSNSIELRAYNSANVLVDTDLITGESALQMMSVAGDDIVRVQLSFTGSVCCVDDMSFNVADAGPCEVILDPVNVTIPAGGGSLSFFAGLTNNTPVPISGQAWIKVQNVGSGNAVETNYFPLLTVPGNTSVGTNFSVYVPGIAPGGLYLLQAFYGNYPWAPICWNAYEFTKAGAMTDNAEVFEHPEMWITTGNFAEVASQAETFLDVTVPNEFSLGAAYPNPFNPSTTLSLNLPDAVKVTVAVYNVAGQQVATLANGTYPAGSHQLSFDASALSGGVYFVRASANSWSSVQKVVLMK